MFDWKEKVLALDKLELRKLGLISSDYSLTLPSTEIMLSRIDGAKTIDEFINEYGHLINAAPFNKHLKRLLKLKKTKKAKIFERAGIHPIYGYQFFDGKRIPCRDKTLQLAFAFELDYDATQELLTLAGKRALHVGDMRDVIIIFALKHHYDLDHTQEALFDNKLPILGEVRT